MLRFLWFDDVNSPDRCVVQFRFAPLPFCLRPSPSILGCTVKNTWKIIEKRKIVEILNEVCVDDLSNGTDTTEKALEIYVGAKEIMKQSGFNLPKWNSNSKELLTKIRE